MPQPRHWEIGVAAKALRQSDMVGHPCAAAKRVSLRYLCDKVLCLYDNNTLFYIYIFFCFVFFCSVTLGQMNNVGTKVIVGDVIARLHEIH